MWPNSFRGKKEQFIKSKWISFVYFTPSCYCYRVNVSLLKLSCERTVRYWFTVQCFGWRRVFWTPETWLHWGYENQALFFIVRHSSPASKVTLISRYCKVKQCLITPQGFVKKRKKMKLYYTIKCHHGKQPGKFEVEIT